MTTAETTPAPASPARASAAVAARGLRKRYGAVQAVDGVSLDIAPGEVVALLGPNGAGKSTTVDMILGLTRPDAGSVSLFGRPPRQAVDAGLVGAMLQQGVLPTDVRVGELVALFASLHRHPMRVGEALERAGIADLARRPTQRLSGGQMQRVRFAMAIVPNPDLFVLDEPTVGLDVEARRGFWASMRELAGSGRTVLFATHYLAEADDVADRVVVMRHGQIVADGAPSQVKGVVGGRRITATLSGADTAPLAALPGVVEVERHGDQVVLRASDSDSALRALLTTFPSACDIEVNGADLEDAFVALTTATGQERSL